MARIKLELPAHFHFSTTIPVRITDINYGGHAGNDAILSIIHEARMRFLAHLHFTEMASGGAALIMSDVAIEFKAEAFYGDEIEVSVTAGDFSRVSFDFYYLLKNKATGTMIAAAKTGMVCFNYNTKKVVSVPEALKKGLQNPLA